MKPEIEEILAKKVSESSIVMAINRLSGRIKPQFTFKNIFKTPPDLIFRTNLVEVIFANSNGIIKKYPKLLKFEELGTKYFFAVTKGVFDTTFILSKDLEKKLEDILKDERVIAKYPNLSSITIRLPKSAIQTPGVFYFFLKSLAWEGVNIIEIVSAHLELTIVLEQKEAQKAFTILQSLFSKENKEII